MIYCQKKGGGRRKGKEILPQNVMLLAQILVTPEAAGLHLAILKLSSHLRRNPFISFSSGPFMISVHPERVFLGGSH